MKKLLTLIALAVGTAVLAAALVISIEVVRDDRADKLAKQNRKLREQVETLTDLVAESNHRIAQLENALREAGIPIPGEDGGTGRTDTSSRKRRAAPS